MGFMHPLLSLLLLANTSFAQLLARPLLGDFRLRGIFRNGRICDNGKLPLRDSTTGRFLCCGRSPDRVDCPSGSECVVHPTDDYAVCCETNDPCASIVCSDGETCDPQANNGAGGCVPDDEPTTCMATGCSGEICASEPVASACIFLCEYACTDLTQCISLDSGVCGWQPNDDYEQCLNDCTCERLECADDETCDPDANSGAGECVPDESVLKCPYGEPLINSTSGEELFCGRGPGSAYCPIGSECTIDPTDRFAVCCEIPDPCMWIRCSSGFTCDPLANNGTGGCVEDSKCSNGDPLTNTTTGEELFCGRGPDRVDCPSGSECVIDPSDAFAVCCETDPCDDLFCGLGEICVANKGTGSCVVQYKCAYGDPLTNSTTGEELVCGRGGIECPEGSQCNIDPSDRYAVCCQTPSPCVVSGCNSEICAEETMFSICIAPTCEQSCLRFAECTRSEIPCAVPPCPGVCGWISNSTYNKCIRDC